MRFCKKIKNLKRLNYLSKENESLKNIFYIILYQLVNKEMKFYHLKTYLK
jgi:hypothetical protein